MCQTHIIIWTKKSSDITILLLGYNNNSVQQGYICSCTQNRVHHHVRQVMNFDKVSSAFVDVFIDILNTDQEWNLLQRSSFDFVLV